MTNAAAIETQGLNKAFGPGGLGDLAAAYVRVAMVALAPEGDKRMKLTGLHLLFTCVLQSVI